MIVRLLVSMSVLFGSGCYTMRADLPGTWRSALPDEDIVVVGRVDVEQSHVFVLSLAPTPAEDIFAAPLLRAVEEAGGDGVANVVIDTHFTASDVAVRVLSLGFITPRTYRIRADVVLLEGEPPPGKPLLSSSRRAVPQRSAPPARTAPTPAEPQVPLDPNEPPPLLGPP